MKRGRGIWGAVLKVVKLILHLLLIFLYLAAKLASVTLEHVALLIKSILSSKKLS